MNTSAAPPSSPNDAARQRVAKLKAFRVHHKGHEIGYLGEGQGPAISLLRSRLPYLWFEHARYTSLDLNTEPTISEIFDKTKSFDEVVSALKAKGMELKPAPYLDLFVPPEQAPRHSPTVRDTKFNPNDVKGF